MSELLLEYNQPNTEFVGRDDGKTVYLQGTGGTYPSASKLNDCVITYAEVKCSIKVYVTHTITMDFWINDFLIRGYRDKGDGHTHTVTFSASSGINKSILNANNNGSMWIGWSRGGGSSTGHMGIIKSSIKVLVRYTEPQPPPPPKPNHSVFYFDGRMWLPSRLSYYDGSKWLDGHPSYYNGEKWEECNV